MIPIAKRTNVTGCDGTAALARWVVTGVLIVSIGLSTACTTPQTDFSWTDWKVSGDWADGGVRLTAAVEVASEPDGAEVRVGNQVVGRTPARISLSYGQETRRWERSYVRSTTTQDWLTAARSVERQTLERQERTETRDVASRHMLRVTKAGFFPCTFLMTAPADRGRTVLCRLTSRETLTIAPAVIEHAIGRETGPFRWARDHIFLRSAIRKDQYGVLADRIARHVQASLLVTGEFRDVSSQDRQDVSGEGGARIELRAILDRRQVSLQGQLTSPSILGSRALTRQEDITMKGFEEALSAGCERLAQALLKDYLAAVPNRVAFR